MAPAIDLVHEEPRRRSRKGLIAAGAAVVVAAAVVAVVLVSTGSKAKGFSLTAAAEQAQTVQSVTFEMDMDVAGKAIHLDATIDPASKNMQAQIDMGALAPGAAGKIAMIIDTKDRTAFIDASTVPALAGKVKTKWIKFDVTQAGVDMSQLNQGISNPFDVAPLFAKAKQVEDLGFEQVRGEKVKHFKVTLDSAAVLALSPELAKQYSVLGSSLPKEFVYDVWVTSGNELRQLNSTVDVANQTVSVHVYITHTDNAATIVIPDAKDVTDISKLGG